MAVVKMEQEVCSVSEKRSSPDSIVRRLQVLKRDGVQFFIISVPFREKEVNGDDENKAAGK